MRHRGFTLIEGVVAMVILSIAVPVSVVMTADAARTRAAALQRERAVMLADVVRTEIVADMASPSHGGGVTLLADIASYQDILRTRIADMTAPYETTGCAWTIDVGNAVGPLGVGSFVAEENIYFPVTITVSWSDAREGPRSVDVTVFVSEIGA
ncbi:MAG: hypothetical protein Tsb0013_09050 [Phycisphaerales bacterium]